LTKAAVIHFQRVVSWPDREIKVCSRSMRIGLNTNKLKPTAKSPSLTAKAHYHNNSLKLCFLFFGAPCMLFSAMYSLKQFHYCHHRYFKEG